MFMVEAGPVYEPVYLDYSATAPMRPAAVVALTSALGEVGNASSPHTFGRSADAVVRAAREQVAALIGCSPGEIVFTSGATEANNLAFAVASGRVQRVVTTAVEHPAVLEAARALASHGCRVRVLEVDGRGRVDPRLLAKELADEMPTLVSVMAANNETGTLLDLAQLVSIAHAAGALVHTDATQFVGKLPIDLMQLDVDLLSLSAHKFGGPQGVGALFVRRGVPLSTRRLSYGGGQEGGWRPGTLNVAGIAGAGAAAEACLRRLDEEVDRVRCLRDRLEHGITTLLPDAWVNGDEEHRLPGTSSITFSGAPAGAVMAAMPDIAVSDGSACSSGAPGPSHVLTAMGLGADDAESTLRFSLGYATTELDVAIAIERTVVAVSIVRCAAKSGDDTQYQVTSFGRVKSGSYG